MHEAFIRLPSSNVQLERFGLSLKMGYVSTQVIPSQKSPLNLFEAAVYDLHLCDCTLEINEKMWVLKTASVLYTIVQRSSSRCHL